MKNMDPEELSPGIRRTVMWLREHGFNTCDSGDGKSNAGMGCALDFPNVHIILERHELVSRADDLRDLLITRGVEVGADPDGPFIQSAYSPGDGVASMSLFNVDDAMLFGKEGA